MSDFRDKPIASVTHRKRNEPGQRIPHGVVPPHGKQETNRCRRAHIDAIVSYDIDGIDGLETGREISDQGLPFIRLNSVDFEFGA